MTIVFKKKSLNIETVETTYLRLNYIGIFTPGCPLLTYWTAEP